MRRDALRDLDADGRNLLVFDPDTRITRQTAGRDAEVAQDVNQRAFEVAQIAANIGLAAKVQDRIAHQLAGSVIGDVTTAVHLQARNFPFRQLVLAEKHVISRS